MPDVLLSFFLSMGVIKGPANHVKKGGVRGLSNLNYLQIRAGLATIF